MSDTKEKELDAMTEKELLIEIVRLLRAAVGDPGDAVYVHVVNEVDANCSY